MLEEDWEVRTSERREVLLRRDASSKSSRGEAPYDWVSTVSETKMLLSQRRHKRTAYLIAHGVLLGNPALPWSYFVDIGKSDS